MPALFYYKQVILFPTHYKTMKRTKKSTIRILYIETNEIQILDIPRALTESGYDVYHANFGIGATSYEERMCRKIVAAIEMYHVQYVVTYDFVKVVAQACLEGNTPYISWIYDAPQKELYTYFALYPSNYIFTFDKSQRNRLNAIGVRNSFYMPLGVHKNMIQMAIEMYKEKKRFQYQTDIAFVGQLYQNSNNEKILQELGKRGLTESEEIIQSCYMKWDEKTTIHGKLDEATILYLREIDNDTVRKQYPYMSEQYYYESAFLARILAYRERIHILNMLAQKYQLDFYTHDTDNDQLSDKINVMPGVKSEQLTYIYSTSKININITLHCIETGASQRIFDVMGAGGFLLSNYQKELVELFIPGEEIVLFHNEQELVELVDYYMEHEEERKRIARNGQKKVLEQYDIHAKLDQMLMQTETVEKKRRKTYLETQAEELREKADLLLGRKEEAAYLELYELFRDKVNETCIQKNTDLGTLREVLECWQRERELGVECIFDNVESLQEIYRKYLQVKHGLWRVEQNLSPDKCREAVDYMNTHFVSKYFIVWVIYANLRDRVETCIKVSRIFREKSIVDSMEILSYALYFFPGNLQLLLEKADLLLENNLLHEALDTLRMIPNPKEEIKEMAQELKTVLGDQ